MSGIWTAVALTAVSTGASMYGANQAAGDARDAGAQQQALLAGIAEQEYGDLLGLAAQAKKQYGQLAGKFDKRTSALIDTLSFTPVRGVLDKDSNGVSYFSQVTSLFAEADDTRRVRVLGDSEVGIRDALGKFAQIASGDFRPIQALAETAQAATEQAARGGAIGYGRDLGARTQFALQLQGTQAATQVGSFLEQFYAPTTAVFQSAMQVADEARREASRKDAYTAAVVDLRLNALSNEFRLREAGLAANLSLTQSAITSRSRGMGAAAQAGYAGQMAGIQYDGQAIQALSSGLASGASLGLQYYGSQQQMDYRKAALGLAGAQAGVSYEDMMKGDFSSVKPIANQSLGSPPPVTRYDFSTTGSGTASRPRVSTSTVSAPRSTPTRGYTPSRSINPPLPVAGASDLSALDAPSGGFTSALLPPEGEYWGYATVEPYVATQ